MPKTRQQKREEAAERQTHYHSLTHEQKVNLIKARRGKSKKELARLAASPLK